MPQATEFDIPFQPKTSPYLAWVRPRTLTWAREHDLLRSDDAERQFLSWDLTRAAALIYANAATRDDLLKIANFFALGFLFDDQADYRSPESVDRFVRAVREMLAIPLRPPSAPLEFACPATRALREMWERMTDEMSPLWCDRFALDYGHFQAANAYEARLSARAEVLDLPTYIRLRRATVGLFYSMDQIEWAGRYELAPRVLTHPVFAGLREATNDTVAWMNDIHSHDREAARQDPHNLLTVLARHHDLTAAQAVGRAMDMTYSALRRFIRLRGEVPAMLDELRLNPSERDAVGESVAGMENWLRGNHDWARATGRYRSTGDAAECPEDLLSVPAHTRAV